MTIECGAMMEKYRSERNNGGNEDEKLSCLQIEDKKFQKLSIRSMKPYRAGSLCIGFSMLKCKSHFIKMLKDVGTIVPKIKETRL